MIKTGRNDPCHCGSGKKYKRCCLQKDQIAESAALAQAAAAKAAEASQQDHNLEDRGHFSDDEDDLTRDSNAAVDLVQQGALDQAEAAARELLVRYPEVHDGYDRLGMVYEARGEPRQAADCYRKVIEFVLAHPEQYAPEFSTVFERLVLKLDPPNAAS